jgi:pimeloyl-ACP methyl ester carboxylesterase
MVAAAYAARHPERVSALVLSNPAPRTSEQAAAMLRQRAERVRRGGMSAIVPGAVDRAFVEQPRDERFQRYLARFAAQDAEAYALSILGLLEADVTADLQAIRCPTLVVAGGNDVLLPPEQAQEVNAVLAHAELVLLEDAAHFAPYQTPEQFARLVLDFVSRPRPPRE